MFCLKFHLLSVVNFFLNIGYDLTKSELITKWHPFYVDTAYMFSVNDGQMTE